jgi:hypothetical protein
MSGDLMDDVFEPMFERMDRGSLEVIRRLEAYADARLEPTVAATARMRAAVMVAAHRQAAHLAADAAGATVALTPPAGSHRSASAGTHRPSWLDAIAWRRPAAAILVGCLTLGVLAGTALAVRPGGLLYQARIWTEAANLPAADAGLARAEAEIQRLGARLDEVEAAAAAGDGAALAAALEAYASIVTEAAAGTAGDPAAAQAVQVAIERHLVVLSLLAATVPAPAQAALQHAIAASTEAIKEIDGAGTPGGPVVENGNGTGTNGGGGTGTDTGNGPGDNSNDGVVPGGANPDGAAGGGATDDKHAAAPVAEPTATAKAPNPSPTPADRDRAPRPTATHQPPREQRGDSSDPPAQDRQ